MITFFSKKDAIYFPKKRAVGGQRLFRVSPKIHPFWQAEAFLTEMFSREWFISIYVNGLFDPLICKICHTANNGTASSGDVSGFTSLLWAVQEFNPTTGMRNFSVLEGGPEGPLTLNNTDYLYVSELFSSKHSNIDIND